MRSALRSAWPACVFFLWAVANFGSAAWDDVLREANARQSQSEPATPQRTEELAIDGTERIDVPLPSDWSSVLTGKGQGKAGSNSKDVDGMLGKIAQIDAMLPDSSPAKAVLLSQFAVAFLHLGDFVQAEQICLRSLRMAERLSGADSEETLMCLSGLFLVYEQIGDYERALQIALDSLGICTRKPALGAKYQHSTLALLASAQLNCGLLAEAEKNSTRALGVARRKASDENGLLLVKPLDVRASVFLARGSYDQALPLLTEALELIDRTKGKPSSNDRFEKAFQTAATDSSERAILAKLFRAYLVAGDLRGAAAARDRYKSAVNAAVKALPAGIRNVRSLQEINLAADSAVLERLTGNESTASQSAHEYIEFHKKNLSNALMLVESQRLSWQSENLSFSLPVAFCSPAELADVVFSWKGAVLDSLTLDKRRLQSSINPNNSAKLEKLAALRRQLAQALIQRPDAADEKTKVLKNKIFGLEREISKASARAQPDGETVNPSLEKVKSALPPKAVLVEFITYRPLPDIRHGEQQYGALVVTRDSNPIWVPLGPSAGIDKVVRRLNSQIQSPASDDGKLADALGQSYEAVFSKIADALPPNTETLFLAPDGALNFLSYVCLRNPDGSLLGEKYFVSYLGSGRDLLKADEVVKDPRVDVFANPDFGIVAQNSAAPEAGTIRALQATALAGLQLPALPGTGAEALAVKSRAESAGWHVEVLSGGAATEEKLNSIKSPAVLHLATHGFFLDALRQGNEAPKLQRGMSVTTATESSDALAGRPTQLSPMLLSGLALAGAQTTIKAWSERKAPPSENDGIITAEEVASLDLHGTWLATLSACDTGVGEVRSGEGVFGLRRAFMVAGVQNLLMTLWPVTDQTTADIMNDFYGEAFRSGDALMSLAKVQRNWLVKLRNEKGLLSAVREAGPFAMVAMSSPAKNSVTVRVDEASHEKVQRQADEHQTSPQHPQGGP